MELIKQHFYQEGIINCPYDEKFILKKDSSKLNLSQSEYIRNLIIEYKIKIPEVKEEPKPKKMNIL